MGYYKTINGVKYDGELFELAENLVKGQGDGRLSKDDASKIYDVVKDSGSYTEIEKVTMMYIRDNYEWTNAGDEFIRTAVSEMKFKMKMKKFNK